MRFTPGCCNCESGNVVCVKVYGCNGNAYPGVSVSISGLGGTFSGTTDGTGEACWSNVAAGSYTISATKPNSRFNDGSGSITVASTGTSRGSITLTAATGYHCTSCCLDPVSDSLTLSFTHGHVFYLTTSPCTSTTHTVSLGYSGGVWTGTITDVQDGDPSASPIAILDFSLGCVDGHWEFSTLAWDTDRNFNYEPTSHTLQEDASTLCGEDLLLDFQENGIVKYVYRTPLCSGGTHVHFYISET